MSTKKPTAEEPSEIELALAEQSSELTDLRRALRTAQQRVAAAKAKNQDLVEAVLVAAADAYLAMGRPVPIRTPARDARRKGKEEVAVWHLTDWQTGKATVSYNMATMDLRVRRFIEKALHITEIQRADHPVREVHVLFGGDMVENTHTFPGQAFEVEAATFEQVMAAANTMEAVVRAALENFEHVSVTAEPGNHGRIGGIRDGVPKGDNWDRVLYKIVEERFRGEKRLSWVCENHWHQRFEIGAYKAVLVHGDEFKGFGGQVPMYGILRKCNMWKSGVLPDFEDVYVGHYHHSNDMALAAGGEVYMTGSTESDNEFAREFVAASARPSQRLHFVDPRKGRVTAKYKIELMS